MLAARHLALTILFAAVAPSIIPPVMAEPANTAGAGTRLCSVFLREYEQDPRTTAWIYLSWAQGYLSAVNLQRAHAGEIVVDMLPAEFDLSRQVAFLRDYCRDLPHRYFDQATIAMYQELRAHSVKALGSQLLP